MYIYLTGKFRRFYRRDITKKYVLELINSGRVLKTTDGRLYVSDEYYFKYTDEYLSNCFELLLFF